MLLIDPKTAHRLTPDEGGEITYLIRVPTVADRPRYKHAVRVAGGRKWTETQLLEAMADGVREILSEDDPQRQPMIDEIMAMHRLWASFYADLRSGIVVTDDQDAFGARIKELSTPPRVKEIELIILDHYPRYAGMIADREVYAEIAANVAARMFLLGWEGGERPYTRGHGEPPDDVLRQIPLTHLAAIGAEIERLMEPDLDRVGNSASLSGTAPGQTVSNGTGTQRRNGRSKTTGGAARSSASPS